MSVAMLNGLLILSGKYRIITIHNVLILIFFKTNSFTTNILCFKLLFTWSKPIKLKGLKSRRY